jgi:hypothetical protein
MRALDVRFGDQYLAAGYRNQMKTRTQHDGEALQEIATAIGQSTHRTSPTLHENHFRTGQRHKTAATSGRQQDTK